MRELLRRVLARPGLFGQMLFVSGFVNILGLASSIYVIQVLNRYLSSGVDATLLTLAVGTALASGCEWLLRRVRHRLCVAFNSYPERHAGEVIFQTLLTARADDLFTMKPGLGRDAMRSLEQRQSAFSPSNIATIMDFPFVVIFIVGVFFLSPILGWVVCVIPTVLVILGSINGYQTEAVSTELSDSAVYTNTLPGAALGGVETVRAFNAGSQLAQRWREASARSQILRARLGTLQNGFQNTVQYLTALMVVAVISTGSMLALSGKMDVGAIMGANILAARALATVSRFMQILPALLRGGAGEKTLATILALPQERQEGRRPLLFQGALELRDVAFAYAGSHTPLFESLSVRLEPGQALMVTGANGVGKTTLIRLLSGLLQPTRGEVFADGIAIPQLDAIWWRQQVAYVPQEPTFIDGSIRDNLTTLNAELSDHEVRKILSRAGLESYLNRLPDGLDTLLVQGGTRLSPGIRRRMALARALTAPGGKLVLLDEPIEGLDQEGVALLIQLLNDYVKEGRTLVVCSHDPKWAKGAGWLLDLNSKPVPRLAHLRE